MIGRLLPLVVVGVVVAVAVGAVVGLSDGPAALRVGDVAISRHELQHELELLAGAKELQVASPTTEGAVTVNVTRQWVLERTLALLADHRLARKGGRVNAADRAQLSDLFAQQFKALRKASPDLRRAYRQIYIAFVALARVEGFQFPPAEGDDPLGDALKAEARRVRVTLDPRYGIWLGDSLSVARPGAVLSSGPG